MFRETFLSSYLYTTKKILKYLWPNHGSLFLLSLPLSLSLYLFLWKPMNGFGYFSIQREQTPPIGVVSEIQRKTFQYVSIAFSWTERFQQEKECMHVHLITNSSNWELLVSCLVCCFFFYPFLLLVQPWERLSKVKNHFRYN